MVRSIMSLNLENVQRIVAAAYFAHARETFGPEGQERVLQLLNSVRLIFQRISPEQVVTSLTVIQPIESNLEQPLLAGMGEPSKRSPYEQIASLLLGAKREQHICVEIRSDGELEIVFLEKEIDLLAISNAAIVFQYRDYTDIIVVGEKRETLPKLATGLASNFATATISELKVALQHYSNIAGPSCCYVLAEIWEGGVNGPRLVLRNRPEAMMRRSLELALSSSLRDATVRPEQNTDETKPVDLRIEWFGSQSSALVEIKWLGKSVAKAEGKGQEGTYTKYGPARAQSGADQLADYMDRERRYTPTKALLGFLVVFDARRRNLKGPFDLLTQEEALYFQDSDLSFDPNYSQTRRDFAEPIRYFLTPCESHFRYA